MKKRGETGDKDGGGVIFYLKLILRGYDYVNDKWCVVANVHQQVLGAADQTTMTSQSTRREEAFHILIQLIINTDKSYTFIFVKAHLSCVISGTSEMTMLTVHPVGGGNEDDFSYVSGKMRV